MIMPEWPADKVGGASSDVLAHKNSSLSGWLLDTCTKRLDDTHLG